MTDIDLDDLRSELDDFAAPKKEAKRSAKEERIIAGFEEIQKFVEEHGYPPQHGEDRDIFERLYAVRLDRLRELEECRNLLLELDYQNLLETAEDYGGFAEEMDDNELLAELGSGFEDNDITSLRHVRPQAEKQAAEEIANRTPCEDFDTFKPLFQKVREELENGTRKSRRFKEDAEIKQGEFFILGGLTAYVDEVGDKFRAPNGEFDARLRVIYSNGTESNLLRRSLQRALYKDEAGRRISDPVAGPLFSGEFEDGDIKTGTIYVLRSNSEDPFIKENREIVHKIGVTGGEVKKRIANAKKDETFLCADVEVVKTVELYNLGRNQFEALIHQIFASVRIDVQITVSQSKSYVPIEWFMVPLFVIDEAISKILDGTIEEYVYDRESASLVKRA